MFIPHRYYMLVARVLLLLMVSLGLWLGRKTLGVPSASVHESVPNGTINDTRIIRDRPKTRARVGTEEWSMNLLEWFVGMSEQARAPNYAV